MEQPETCVIFREVQDLRSNLILFAVLYPAVLLWGIEIYSLFFGKPSMVRNISELHFFMLLVIFGVFFPLLFYCIRYITEVRKDGIYIRLIPLNRSFKKIPFYMVQECKIQAYDPFTGQDMEVSKASKRVNLVVILKLISGKRMLISSKKPEELCRAITQAAAQ
ncbi:MAG: DUF6141 family protein [Methanosarcina sp.]|jgi:hypothetical protein|uniref:DUF6141 family protein n=1 Tax=Methanosarcina sp. TaxID=2213 RepID=UPI003BB7106D